MPARRAAAKTALQPVLCCIPDARGRVAVQGALRRHATTQWLDSFADLRQRIEGSTTAHTVVVALRDGRGESALALATAVKDARVSLIVWCETTDQGALPDLAAAGVHDVLLGDLAGQDRLIRSVILGAAAGAAADLVLASLAGSIPGPLVGFVELAVRRPRAMQRVSDLAESLRIPRQTLSRWCRDRRYLKPEELLHWSRMFLVAALIETTGWTGEAIAAAMSYASATALRNRIRAYTGLTTTAIRSGGRDAVKGAFDARVLEVKREAERQTA
jgi:hypothetical protein